MVRHPRLNEDTEETDESGFLKRWSKRKAGSEDSSPTQTELSSDQSEELDDDQSPPEAEEPVKTDADMPDIDSIDEKTDMSDFFSPGVSEELRTKALRHLFHLPKFNVVDGLNDYDDDFRNFELLGDIITSDMRHQMEVEKEREEQEKALQAEQADQMEMEDDSAEELAETEDEEKQDQAAAGHDPSDVSNAETVVENQSESIKEKI